MSWGNVTLTEVLWTLFPIIGIYFSRRNLKFIDLDRVALTKMNGRVLMRHRLMRVIVYGHYRNEMIRIMILGVMVLVGVAAMISPPANPANPISALQVVVLIGFFSISGLVVLAAALDNRQRMLLKDMASEARTPPSGARSEVLQRPTSPSEDQPQD